MMLVAIEGFGRIWERRGGKDPGDPLRFSAQAAFYNTTGVPAGQTGKVQHRWRIGGKVRFQGGSAFDSARVENNLGRVFECDEPEQRFTWLQMCCKRKLQKPERPDWFLFRGPASEPAGSTSKATVPNPRTHFCCRIAQTGSSRKRSSS